MPSGVDILNFEILKQNVALPIYGPNIVHDFFEFASRSIHFHRTRYLFEVYALITESSKLENTSLKLL